MLKVYVHWHMRGIFCPKPYNLHDGVSYYMREDCDDVKALRPLLLSIFNTGNETCSCFNCALTFTVRQRTLNSHIQTFMHKKKTRHSNGSLRCDQNKHCIFWEDFGIHVNAINLELNSIFCGVQDNFSTQCLFTCRPIIETHSILPCMFSLE